jgi:hypothetical protein
MHCTFLYYIIVLAVREYTYFVRIADIGGIDDHHCLNFLFITFDTIMENYQEDATEQITSLSCYDGFVY